MKVIIFLLLCCLTVVLISTYKLDDKTQTYEWVSYSHDDVPVNAVKGGYDCDGYDIFIGKVYYHGEMPCKLVPDRKQSYVSFNGREHSVDGCEILVGSGLRWKAGSGNNIPANAVPGGKTFIGETLYIGRARYACSLSIGKVHPSHRALFIPFDGSEVRIKDFEILVSA